MHRQSFVSYLALFLPPHRRWLRRLRNVNTTRSFFVEILLRAQQWRQRLAHVPLRLLFERADKLPRAHKFIGSMPDRAEAEIHGLLVPEHRLDLGEPLVGRLVSSAEDRVP